MKLLLCSDFSGVGYRYLKYFFKKGTEKAALFVGYACLEDAEMYESGAKARLEDFGFRVVDLTPNYKFNEKIDAIFVRGGNVTKLIDYLKKYNQFEKLKTLVQQGILYIGNSAGSVLAGSDTEWTLASEPYPANLKSKYGRDALHGYGFIDKLVFVHASRYRMCRDYEQASPDDIFRTLDTDCYPAYLKDIRHYKREEYIKIANNEVYIESGKMHCFKKYDWRGIRVKI